jgi:hypothetical protein
MEDNAVSPDDAAITDPEAFDKDDIRAQVPVVSDSDWSPFYLYFTPRDCLSHRFLCVNLCSGADETVVPDRQPTRTIQHRNKSGLGILTRLLFP